MKKTSKITLADGKEYTLTTLNVGDLIEIEKKFGSIEINMGKVENIVYWIWLSIKEEHKQTTLEDLYKLIDMPFIADGGVDKLFVALSSINNLDKVSKNVESPAEEKQV